MLKRSIRDQMKETAQRELGERQQEIAIVSSKKKLEAGIPIFVALDKVVSPNEIIGELLIDTFGVKTGQRVALKQAIGHTFERTALTTAITGNQWVSPLTKGDIIGFD